MKEMTFDSDELKKVLSGEKTMTRIAIGHPVCLEPYMPAYDGVCPLYVKGDNAYVLAEVCPDGQMDYNDRLIKPYYGFKETVAIKHEWERDRPPKRKAVVTDIKVQLLADATDDDIRKEGFASRKQFETFYLVRRGNCMAHLFAHVYTFRLLPDETTN